MRCLDGSYICSTPVEYQLKCMVKFYIQQLQEKDKVIEELQEKLKPPVYHDVEKYYE